MYSTTSFSGDCPKGIWDQFKEVPPNNQNTNDKQVCAIAVYVAIFRYEFLDTEEKEMIHQILQSQVPSPGSNPGGSIAETLLEEIEHRGGET